MPESAARDGSRTHQTAKLAAVISSGIRRCIPVVATSIEETSASTTLRSFRGAGLEPATLTGYHCSFPGIRHSISVHGDEVSRNIPPLFR